MVSLGFNFTEHYICLLYDVWMFHMYKCDWNEINQVKPDVSQSHQIM